MRQIVFVVLDGMGDRPIQALGDLTPLEAAATPVLDGIAERGRQGMLDPIGPGVVPASDTAVMSLLGYDVAEQYTGRGPLEAIGAGMELREGDLAWRAGFATVDADVNVLDRRAGRSLLDAEAVELAAALQKDVHLPGASVHFRSTGGHRAALVVRAAGEHLSAAVTNADPGYLREGRFTVPVADPDPAAGQVDPLDDTPAAQRAADLTNTFLEQAFRVLDSHPVNQRRRDDGYLPANFILLREAGDRPPQLAHFLDRYGLRFAAVAQMPVERAMATLTGMTVIDPGRMTGAMEHDYTLWARHAADALRSHDGVYVHLKGPDLAGHAGDAAAKAETLAAIDGYFFGRLGETVDLEAVTVCVTADHATPCELKVHTDDAVPLLVSGGVEPDGAGSFGEVNAFRGGFGRMVGPELMPRLVEIAKG
ncbi:MAG: 2,3-bisphosphoglycerate-independent phosphoglycerate mutase [Chloroflexota bacterium]|jgi:2,3-bisphosphoglycerate-independent phosphoglycerate mutase|nr:2,3-bisphosphoglycerate-independent phosphoglycerate mutase [Chloroflexota bacterium]